MSAKTKNYWSQRARNLLKGELARRGVTYSDLAVRLKEIGVKETPENIRNKINRGTFSAAFLLQVLQALGARSIDVRLD